MHTKLDISWYIMQPIPFIDIKNLNFKTDILRIHIYATTQYDNKTQLSNLVAFSRIWRCSLYLWLWCFNWQSL